MANRYVVNLTAEESDGLEQLVKRERVSGLKRQRASILLRAHQGLTDEEIAEEVGAGVATVGRVRKRCVERGVAECLDRKAQANPSRPRKFDGAAEARLVQIACSSPPEGRARWTLNLLADRLVRLEVFEEVSDSSVQRALKKNNGPLRRQEVGPAGAEQACERDVPHSLAGRG